MTETMTTEEMLRLADEAEARTRGQLAGDARITMGLVVALRQAVALAAAVTRHRNAIRILHTFTARTPECIAAEKECGEAYEELLRLGSEP